MDPLSVIADILKTFADLIPDICMVAENEGGVAWVRGKGHRLKAGSWFIYWPKWTEVDKIPTHRDSAVLFRGTYGGLVVSCVISYSVYDAPKAVTNLGCDVSTEVINRASKIMATILTDATEADICERLPEYNSKLAAEANSELYQFGITVHTMFIREYVECKTYNLLGWGE